MKRLVDYLRNKFYKPKVEAKASSNETPIDLKNLQGYTPEEMFGEDIPKKEFPGDFQTVSKYLSIRLYKPEVIEHFKSDALIYKKDLDGTLSVLMYDLPDSVETVLRSHTKHWGISDETLFKIALDNLKDNPSRETEKTSNGFVKILGNDPFLTSEIFFLNRNEYTCGTFGAIVCIPNKESIISKPISNDLDVEVGLQFMIPMTHDLFDNADTESAITSNIYWFYKGKLELIYTYYNYSKLKFVLPPDLEELVY